MLIILFSLSKQDVFLHKIDINYLLSPILCYFFYLYKIIIFTFCAFLYIMMYILNIGRVIKKISIKTLSLETIIKELDFLRKTVVIQKRRMRHEKKKKKKKKKKKIYCCLKTNPENSKEHY